jgi:hypothetical protein
MAKKYCLEEEVGVGGLPEGGGGAADPAHPVHAQLASRALVGQGLELNMKVNVNIVNGQWANFLEHTSLKILQLKKIFSIIMFFFGFTELYFLLHDNLFRKLVTLLKEIYSKSESQVRKHTSWNFVMKIWRKEYTVTK